MKIKFKLRVVLWNDHGVWLYDNDIDHKYEVARLLRRLPKKRDIHFAHGRGKLHEIEALPYVAGYWY